MRLEGPAERPTTSIGQPDGHHHRPLHSEIAHRAHAPGPAGAGLPGIEGSGASSSVHTTRLLPLSAGTAR